MTGILVGLFKGAFLYFSLGLQFPPGYAVAMELIVGLIAIAGAVVSIVRWRWKKRLTYEENINVLPRRLRSFNLNEIKCLQDADIVDSDTELTISDLEELVTNHDDAIIRNCLGSHEVIHEILDLAKAIRKYERLFPF